MAYRESHFPSTNEFGLVNLVIGSGSNTAGVFDSINWGTNSFFLRVELDQNGGTNYTTLGTSQLLSVPYALYAKAAGTGDDVDTDTTNELQILSIKGNELSISQGNAVSIPSTSGLSLPYSGSYSGNQEAFSITSTGSDDLTYFEVNGSQGGNVMKLKTNSGSDVIKIENNGTNRGISLINSSTSRDAIAIANTGTGNSIDINHGSNADAFQITSDGTGEVADLRISNSSNKQEVIFAQTKGTGVAGWFEISNSNSGSPAILAITNGTGKAGEFEGDVEIYGDLNVSGDISKGSGSFRIDHPLDPQNKYLYHSFVESPDMMNVYNGNVILDDSGEAWVELPAWFMALNKDYRYQLTCIGGYAQVYIAEEISDNRFRIAGGYGTLKVSWQITGIRNDPYAQKNRIQVEVEKEDEDRGYYLHYDEYGVPYEQSIQYIQEQKSE